MARSEDTIDVSISEQEGGSLLRIEEHIFTRRQAPRDTRASFARHAPRVSARNEIKKFESGG